MLRISPGLLLCSFLVLSQSLSACDSEEETPLRRLAPPPFAGEVITHPDGWLEVKPGGDTRCSRGSEYSYFVRPGLTDKLLVEFQGGGACWNTGTCSIAGAIFTETVDAVRQTVGVYKEGIYDHSNPDNPFQNWTHVFVPYCTGDVHWGNKTEDYGAFTIEHNGYNNSLSAMSWIAENITAPSKVAVTGCSAGGYGSLLWSGWLMEYFPDSDVVQFSDSATGIITDAFFKDSFPSWGVERAFPSWIPELDLNRQNYLDLDLAKTYQAIANHYPDQILAHFTTLWDSTQIRYYQYMNGGTAEEWSTKMTESINGLTRSTPNFATYIAPGAGHCIINKPDFYTLEVGGKKFVDWVRDLVFHAKIENTYCDSCSGFIKR